VTTDPGSGQELCAVFVATAPNPTTGFVLLVKRADLIDLDWTVEEAIQVIMSGGVLLPGPEVPTRDSVFHAKSMSVGQSVGQGTGC
ncbi:MAG: hypothetical protein JXO22_11365, partial [Phycisphaerae bacterium]|nr:hypothetical protein [Phycisphaerae bacterium]